MSATFKCGDESYTVTIKKESQSNKNFTQLSKEVYEQLINPSDDVKEYFLQS
tara:strand:- start:169 stop:324 length:156 start_codon:yes stop_codon:yes gene_type:complete